MGIYRVQCQQTLAAWLQQFQFFVSVQKWISKDHLEMITTYTDDENRDNRDEESEENDDEDTTWYMYM